jgi:GT2 family glycosyltransferase
VHPEISIIISTCCNLSQLLRVLESLSRQALDPKCFEVVVVNQGCKNQIPAHLEGLSTTYRLVVLDHPSSNQAAARNYGSQAATSPLLLFLGDDIVASELLVIAHLQAHEMHPGGIALGYFPVGQEQNDLLADLTRLEWSEIFSSHRNPSHRFAFFDTNNTNISLSRQLFVSVGGYDEDFYAYEDLELGIRLLKQRARLHFVPDACGVYCPKLSESNLFRSKVEQGRAQVQLLRKHPEVSTFFPLGYDPHGRLRYRHKLTKLLRSRLIYKTAFRLLLSLLMLPLSLAKALKLRATYHGLLEYACSNSYWNGVFSERGSDGQKRSIADFPDELFNNNEIEVDMKTDWAHLDEMLGEDYADAITLRHGETPLGRIAPVVGAETLRPSHVRNLVIELFANELLSILYPDVRNIFPRFVSSQFYLKPDAFYAPIILFNKYKNRLHNYNKKFIPLLAGAWHKVEYAYGIPFRWLDGDASLFIYSEEDIIAVISFKTQAFYHPRTLEIIMHGLILDQYHIQADTLKTIHFIAILNIGINIIGLHTVEGAARPSEIPELHSKDDRPMSILMGDLKIADISSLEIDPIFSISERYKNRLFIILSNGWFGSEAPDGQPTRWIGEEAACELYLMEKCRFELSLQASSFRHSRTLEILLADRLLSRFVIPTDYVAINAPIELDKGIHKIRFCVPDGCERPSGDSRCLGVRLRMIKIGVRS